MKVFTNSGDEYEVPNGEHIDHLGKHIIILKNNNLEEVALISMENAAVVGKDGEVYKKNGNIN